jgi:hypothetical protein
VSQDSINVAVLRRALEYIEQGWCQHSLVEENEAGDVVKHCALGALIAAERALAHLEEERELIGLLADVVQDRWGDTPEWISATQLVTNYNDSPQRVKQDIVTLYEEAIQLEEQLERGNP